MKARIPYDLFPSKTSAILRFYLYSTQMTTTSVWPLLMHLPTTSSNLWRTSIKQTKHRWKSLYVLSMGHRYAEIIFSFQFSSIDPAKINSHFGVRTDLFQRPLSKTRITDFFGGVAQAEIISTTNIRTSSSAADEAVKENLEKSELHDVEEQRNQSVVRQGQPNPPVGIRTSLFEAWSTRHKTLRTWGSVVLLGSLVGWVSSRS